MSRLVRLFSTSIGRKVIVAVTGLLLIGFLLGHLVGNLLVFSGREALNAYAAWLKSSPLLWPARLGLLGLFGTHIALAVGLARENRAARPSRYVIPVATAGSRRSSRYVLLTGLVVLAFVIYHLLHFTLGVVDAEGHDLVDARGRHDVFGMVVHSFADPLIVTSYAVAMLLLGVHLWHGAASVVRTLGLGHPTWQPLARIAAHGLVAVIVAGNVLLPLLVFAGVTGPAEIMP